MQADAATEKESAVRMAVSFIFKELVGWELGWVGGGKGLWLGSDVEMEVENGCD